jgi:hypothetical protein
MWAVETFLEIHITNSLIKKIPLSSSLTDNDSTILSEDLVIKTNLGWKNKHYALIYPIFVPFVIEDIYTIIKKQHKYKILC